VPVDVQPEVMDKLVVGDKFLVKAFGVGLQLLGAPQITVMNRRKFLTAMKPMLKGDKLVVPVTHIVPAAIMGSGLGANQTYSGDYDIQLFDEKVRKQFVLNDLSGMRTDILSTEPD
jgi:hypothetical protein